MGYEIRFESEKPRDVGSITFCTTGIVFQKLKTNPLLSDVSHIILDEVHERDLYADVLLGVLKTIISKSKALKVVVMSASLDIKMFQKYLDCPVVEVPGRTFEVKRLYLEDFIGDYLTSFTSLFSTSMNDLSIFNRMREQNEYARR